jgi:hypothetical protein
MPTLQSLCRWRRDILHASPSRTAGAEILSAPFSVGTAPPSCKEGRRKSPTQLLKDKFSCRWRGDVLRASPSRIAGAEMFSAPFPVGTAPPSCKEGRRRSPAQLLNNKSPLAGAEMFSAPLPVGTASPSCKEGRREFPAQPLKDKFSYRWRRDTLCASPRWHRTAITQRGPEKISGPALRDTSEESVPYTPGFWTTTRTDRE